MDKLLNGFYFDFIFELIMHRSILIHFNLNYTQYLGIN